MMRISPTVSVMETLLAPLLTFLSLAQLHLLHGQHGQGDGLLGGALQEADEDHQPSVDIENVTIR